MVRVKVPVGSGLDTKNDFIFTKNILNRIILMSVQLIMPIIKQLVFIFLDITLEYNKEKKRKNII